MATTTQDAAPKPEPLVTKRSLGWAGAAAFLACAACCALPMLALASGGVLGSLAAFLGQGGELIAALTAGGATLLYFGVRAARRAKTCETSCAVDASCCGESPERKAS